MCVCVCVCVKVVGLRVWAHTHHKRGHVAGRFPVDKDGPAEGGGEGGDTEDQPVPQRGVGHPGVRARIEQRKRTMSTRLSGVMATDKKMRTAYSHSHYQPQSLTECLTRINSMAT